MKSYRHPRAREQKSEPVRLATSHNPLDSDPVEKHAKDRRTYRRKDIDTSGQSFDAEPPVDPVIGEETSSVESDE